MYNASSLCADFARSNEQAASLGRDLKVEPDTLQLGRIPGIELRVHEIFLFVSFRAQISSDVGSSVQWGASLNVRR